MTDTEYLHVGHVVTVVTGTQTSEAGEAGRRGVICEVRRYPDGSFQYSVGYFEDGEMGGLYPSDWLVPTGETRGIADGTPIFEPRAGRSTRVSTSGDVLGENLYEVLEYIEYDEDQSHGSPVPSPPDGSDSARGSSQP